MGITLEEMRIKALEIERLQHELEVLSEKLECGWEEAAFGLENHEATALYIASSTLLGLEQKVFAIKRKLRKLGAVEESNGREA